MRRVRIGGYPFKLPRNWGEVTHEQAKRLAHTTNDQLAERLEILGRIPAKRLTPDAVFALYPLIQFIEHLPPVTPNRVEVPAAGTWRFVDFEVCRREVARCKDTPSLALWVFADQLKLDPKHYVEIGAKALDSVHTFLETWATWGIFNSEGPTPDEKRAGIERLQAFGVYSMLEPIATKYKRLPREIEVEPTNWVFTEYTYTKEGKDYLENLNPKTAKT